MKVCVFVAGSAVIMLNCVMYFAEPVSSLPDPIGSAPSLHTD